MKSFVLILTYLICFTSYSQNKTTVAGEQLVYTASYNMFGLLTDLGQIKLETSEVKTNKNTLLRLKLIATTYKKWDNYFKIRNLYESYVNPKTLTPYLFKKDLSENGNDTFIQYKYNHKSKLIKSLERKKNNAGESLDENKNIKIDLSTRDFLSTLYTIRNIDLQNTNQGDQKKFTVIYDKKEIILSVTYINQETISTKIGNKECYKLAVSIKEHTNFNGENRNFLWLTTDVNKVPVYAEFETYSGKCELKIESTTAQKN